MVVGVAYLSTSSVVLESLLKDNETQGKEEHDGPVTSIPKHHSKQEWERYDGEQSWSGGGGEM